MKYRSVHYFSLFYSVYCSFHNKYEKSSFLSQAKQTIYFSPERPIGFYIIINKVVQPNKCYNNIIYPKENKINNLNN